MVYTKLEGNKTKIFLSSTHFHIHFDSTIIMSAWGLMGCDLLMRLETTISMLMISEH